MILWDQDGNTLVHRKKIPGGSKAPDFAPYPPGYFAYQNITETPPVNPLNLPANLLILNRFGVEYSNLAAAHKLATKYHINAGYILVKARIITDAIWHDSQKLLAFEQQKARALQRRRQHLLYQAIHNLKDNLPHYSASVTFTNAQMVAFALACGAVSYALISSSKDMILGLLMLVALFYSATILLRGLVIAAFDGTRKRQTAVMPIPGDEALPVYSVLVALHHEQDQIEELTRHLWQLDWPKEKLDIKLVCEADDHQTIAAIHDANLAECFELVCVPPAHPRTKPKALNYALPLCRGEFVVLYDAEDRPSPGQLREAFMKFLSEDDKLACLQAPLTIHNHDQNWLSRMFAIEYITLFHGILPVLAKWQVPIPLGGTSNHFNGVR